jgi:hypothetical protein
MRFEFVAGRAPSSLPGWLGSIVSASDDERRQLWTEYRNDLVDEAKAVGFTPIASADFDGEEFEESSESEAAREAWADAFMTHWVRCRPGWRPQHALRYARGHIDPIHGAGPWALSEFLASLAEDREEIEKVVGLHPRRADQFKVWLSQMEEFGTRRDADSCPRESLGSYYQNLSALGYGSDAEEGR